MALLDQIKMLAKKTTGKDIAGETIQEALNNFEKAVAEKPVQQQTQPRYERKERKAQAKKESEE